MYEIYKIGKTGKARRLPGLECFWTYDDARCFIRKKLRKEGTDPFAPFNNPALGSGDYKIYYNPVRDYIFN